MEEKRCQSPAWAMLKYSHQASEVQVEISIQRNAYLNQTRPMIRRVAIHPWTPESADE